MTEAFDLKQDNLLLQLKNMPKPPISKELAKEIGFDEKKYEVIIEKLLTQISEVRQERMKENHIFEAKIKSMQISEQNKNKKIIIKNNTNNNVKKNNNKNLKIKLNRPKSNYKAVRSSGYGMAPKKIDIFSTRAKKKIIDNNKNTNINNNNNKNKKLIPKGKIINNNAKRNNNNNNNSNINKEHIKNIENDKKIHKNNLNINKEKIINNQNQNIDLNKIKNELDIINKENKLLEEQYSKLKKQNDNMQKNNNNKILYKNNHDLIKNNVEGISKSIINGLLYELIDDLNNIENKKREKEKEKINIKKPNIKKKKIIKIYKANPDKKLIERCNIYRNKFFEHMKLKGSFISNNIFKIYDDFVKEMTNEICDNALNYCIEQIDSFIKKIENQK